MKCFLFLLFTLAAHVTGWSQVNATFTFTDTLDWEGKKFPQLDRTAKVIKGDTKTRIVFNQDFEFSLDQKGVSELSKILDTYLIAEIHLSQLTPLGSVTSTFVQALSRTKDAANENKYSMTWGKGVPIDVLYNGTDLCFQFPEIESGIAPRIVKSNVHRFWIQSDHIEQMIAAIKE